MAKIKIDQEKCKGCELCVRFCPKGCIKMAEGFNKKGFHPSNFAKGDECTGCAICAQICPDVAIEVWR